MKRTFIALALVAGATMAAMAATDRITSCGIPGDAEHVCAWKKAQE